jgi:glycolate oxidase
MRKDVAGYDLSSLFVGSESTLGVIALATLRLRPVPPFPPLTFVASFSSLGAIGDAVDRIHESGIVPSMLELIDSDASNAIENYRAMGLDRSWAGVLIGQADAAESDLLEARRIVGPAIMATGPTVIKDIGVPPGQLTRMLEAIRRVSADRGVAIALTAHAGDGNLHPALMLPDLSPGTVPAVPAAE